MTKFRQPRPFPYFPSTAPGKKQELLNEIGLDSVEDIYKEIPKHLRFNGRLNIPEPIESEYEYKGMLREFCQRTNLLKIISVFLVEGPGSIMCHQSAIR